MMTPTANVNPYGLKMSKDCISCHLRKEHWFCCLPAPLMDAFSPATLICAYPARALLFVKGQTPLGAFVLCSGSLKLYASDDLKTLIVKVVHPGEIVGLSAVISSTPHEVTAETITPCQVNFIHRKVLLSLMETHGEMGVHLARALSTDYQSTSRDIRDLVLTRSSKAKLARLLLSWIRAANERDHTIVIKNPYTHEEMAQMIGVPRETVTRLLLAMKKKHILQTKGSNLMINNPKALQALWP